MGKHNTEYIEHLGIFWRIKFFQTDDSIQIKKISIQGDAHDQDLRTAIHSDIIMEFQNHLEFVHLNKTA